MRPRSILLSPHFGEIECDSESELLLPAGLPGFETERRMLPVEIPSQRPLVFLQSLAKPDLCFVTLPVGVIRHDYSLALSSDDRRLLLFTEESGIRIGVDVLCLALIMPSGETVQANLGAPIVINLHNSRCIQAGENSRECYRLIGNAEWEPVC